MKQFRSFITMVAFLSPCACFAQQPLADTTFLTQASVDARHSYERSMIGQSHLNNGTEYLLYDGKNDEHPYLIDDWTEGAVFYDGELFEKVPIIFDIVEDRLITEHYPSRRAIRLIDNKVDYFFMQDRKFVKLTGDQVPKGFYKLEYSGATRLYVRRQKLPQVNLDHGEVNHFFEEKVFYYLYKGGQFYAIKSKREALRVFEDHKSEVSRYLSQSKIRFKQDKEASLARMAQYYDSIER